MADNHKSDVANYVRSKYGLPLSASDEEVIDYAHEKNPQEMEEITKAALGPGMHMPSMADVGNMASAAYGKANSVAEMVPGLKRLGEMGKWLGSTAQEGAKQVGETFGQDTNVGRSAQAAASLVDFLSPKDALGAGLAIAPVAGEALGGLSKALKPVANALGGAGKALAGSGAAEEIAALGRGMTGVPAKDLEYLLSHPEGGDVVLKRALPPEKAGEVMNQLAEQFGVKTGKEALKDIPGIAGKAAPTYSDANAYVNAVHSNMDKIEQLDHYKKALQELKSQNLSTTATQDIYSNAVQTGTEGGLGGEGSRGVGMKTPMPEYAGQSHADILKKDLEGWIEQLEKPVMRGGAPTMQDLVSARQVLSKQLQAPKFATPLPKDQVIGAVAQENLSRIDDTLGKMMEGRNVKPVEVPGYGQVSSFEQARNIYRESMIKDKMSNFFAINNNSTPSVMRMFASFLLGKGNPLMGAASMAADSPAMWSNAIKAAGAIRDMKALPSTAAGMASSAMPSAGSAAGALASLNVANSQPAPALEGHGVMQTGPQPNEVK